MKCEEYSLLMFSVSGLTDSVSDSPDSEGFIVVSNKTKTTPSKLKSIESSFIQKSAAISSSIKTTAMAIPIKHGYSQEHLTDFGSSPRGAQSPLEQRLAIDSDKVPDMPFRRESPRRLSGMRNTSVPNFVKRTWSLEGHKRHRTSSESAKQNTPPRMDLVSKSVRQSPTRRPFSANFEDSYYNTPSARPLSASRTSTGQSAPAYFFIGGSPGHTSPPSFREASPLQLTFGDTSPPFAQPLAFTSPPELSETTIMDVSRTWEGHLPFDIFITS